MFPLLDFIYNLYKIVYYTASTWRVLCDKTRLELSDEVAIDLHICLVLAKGRNSITSKMDIIY